MAAAVAAGADAGFVEAVWVQHGIGWVAARIVVVVAGGDVVDAIVLRAFAALALSQRYRWVRGPPRL